MINEAKEKYYSLIVEPHIWYHIRIQYGNMSFIENIGYNAFRIHLWYVFHWKYRLQAFRINLQCDPEIKKTKLIKKAGWLARLKEKAHSKAFNSLFSVSEESSNKTWLKIIHHHRSEWLWATIAKGDIQNKCRWGLDLQIRKFWHKEYNAAGLRENQFDGKSIIESLYVGL
jgi:hypothetical protein